MAAPPAHPLLSPSHNTRACRGGSVPLTVFTRRDCEARPSRLHSSPLAIWSAAAVRVGVLLNTGGERVRSCSKYLPTGSLSVASASHAYHMHCLLVARRLRAVTTTTLSSAVARCSLLQSAWTSRVIQSWSDQRKEDSTPMHHRCLRCMVVPWCGNS